MRNCQCRGQRSAHQRGEGAPAASRDRDWDMAVSGLSRATHRSSCLSRLRPIAFLFAAAARSTVFRNKRQLQLIGVDLSPNGCGTARDRSRRLFRLKCGVALGDRDVALKVANRIRFSFENPANRVRLIGDFYRVRTASSFDDKSGSCPINPIFLLLGLSAWLQFWGRMARFQYRSPRGGPASRRVASRAR